MTIDFYYSPISGPCRIVLLAAEAIGVKLNLKLLNLFKGEQLTPEFLKINPQHTIPTIDDNGFSLWESRVIITYLQNQYGKNDSLYPKDPKKRAVVDHRLYFDMGSLFASVMECYFRSLILDPEKVQNVDKALKIFDDLLDKSKFAAGDNFTLADISLVVSVSTMEVLGHDLSPYENIARWYALVKDTAPGYAEVNEKSLQKLKEFMDQRKKKFFNA